MREFIVAALCAVLLASPVLAEESPPDTSVIEAAHAAWAAKSNRKNRKALDAALEAYDGPPTTATIKAHLERMSYDASNSTPSKLRKSAKAAGEHMEPVSDLLPQHYTDARMISAIALFNQTQSRDALLEMAHAEGWVRYWRKSQKEEIDEALWDQLKTLEYRAMAWNGAMDAFYQSTPKRGPKEAKLEAIYASYEVVEDQTDEESEYRELPFCEGTLVQEPPVRYNRKQAGNYKFGAVIATFEFVSGKVSNLEIVASVPRPEFDKNAKKAISQWYWEAAETEIVGESCSLDRKNIVQPVVFSLSR